MENPFENIWKDYESVGRRVHDGESVLDFFAVGGGGSNTMLSKSLADTVETVSDYDPGLLKKYPEFSFDVMACFGSYNAKSDYAAGFFPSAMRVLKPAGRLLMLVPDALCDFFVGVGSKSLIFESATPGKCFPKTKLLMFMRNPLVGRSVPLCETCWKVPSDPDYHMNAFQKDYLNPWLVRGIVSGCGKGRLENAAALEKIRDEILKTYPKDSVDYGAALCGKIYAADISAYDKLSEMVEHYTAIANPSPHQLRWQVSCGFALAVLAKNGKRLDDARKWFAYASDGDVCKFSATLGTKVMDACWTLALMCLDDGDVDGALGWLRKSFARADEIVHASWLNVVGDISRPVPIAYDEIALVCQKAARAAGMVNVLDRYPNRLELASARAVSNAERLAKAQLDVKFLKDKLKTILEENKKLKEKGGKAK